MPNRKSMSSHWSSGPLSPVLQATMSACNTKYAAHDLFLGYLMELLQFSSVADFGCGPAKWLAGAKRLGLDDIKGYDIAEVDISDREIDESEFVEVDLSRSIDTGREYDLVISMEVAEHIPAECADVFIDNLCAAGDIVLFSAAIPYQGGMGHINENWMEYWHQKFTKNEFLCFDVMRPKFWNEPRAEWYYRQNSLLYVHRRKRQLVEQQGFTASDPMSMIHPDMYLKAIHRVNKPSASFFDDIKKFYRFAFRG